MSKYNYERREVKIESSYKTKTQVDEGKTKSNDMLLKNLKPVVFPERLAAWQGAEL